MKKEKHNYKLTDEQFIEAFRACEGSYTQTARYIQERFRMPYSKQAVQDRAEKHPEEIEKMYRALDNESYTGIMKFAGDESNDVKLRARLYVQMMNKVKHRERLKLQADKADVTMLAKQQKPEQVYEIGDFILHFPSKDKELTPEQEQEWQDFHASPTGKRGDKTKLDAPTETH